MKFEELREPKKFTIGNVEYYIAKIPAYYAQRLLIKSGEALKSFDVSKIPDDVLKELLSYTAVVNSKGDPIVLEDIETVNLLLGGDTKSLIAIEMQAIQENFGFFLDGGLREIFDPIVKRMIGEEKTSSQQG